MTKAYQKEVQGKASQYEETTSICIVLLVGNELIGYEEEDDILSGTGWLMIFIASVT